MNSLNASTVCVPRRRLRWKSAASRLCNARRTLSPDDMRDLAQLDAAAVSQVRGKPGHSCAPTNCTML